MHGEDFAVSVDSKSGDAINEKTTKRLLSDAPLGSFDSRTWYEAEWTVRFWNRQRSVPSVKYSLDLLDRFIREYCHQCQENNKAMPLPKVLTTANLNFTVNNWQLCAKSCPTPASRSDLLNPTEMVEMIDALVCYHEKVPAITDHRDESLEHFPLQPNIYTYSMILDALAFSQPDKPQLEYEILEELGDLAIHKMKDARGNIGWTYLGTPAPVLADLLLHRLLEEFQSKQYLRPSIVTFNSVINVWARSRLPEAPEKAEELLRQVQQLSSEPGWESLKPTNTTYGSVLNTWGNSLLEEAPVRAHALLQEMEDSNDHEIYPNTEIYLGVLKAWGHSHNSEAAAHASRVLYELIRKYRKILELTKQGNEGESAKIRLGEMKPSVQCFLSVMNIYTNNGDVKGATDLLNELQALYEESGYDDDLCPNAATFNGVIRAWSRSMSKDAVTFAETIIEGMQKLAESTDNSNLYPNVVSYNSLLHALSKSDDLDVVKRAEEVFQTMLDTPEIKPDLITYNVMLYLLGRSKQNKAAEKSEAFLRKFWDQYNAGIIDFKPDATSYNTCIDAWKYFQLKSDQVKRAESLFLDMQAQFRQTGDTRLKPTRVSYGSMIAVWGRASHRAGAKRAQYYFDEMVANGISPTIIEYNAAIHAWASVGGVEQGEKLLQKALEDYQNGNQLAKPDVKSFSSVLNALAKRKSSDPVSDAAKAEAILVQMEELSATLGPGVKPNERSFNAVLDCFAKCRKNETAAKHAEAILGHMKVLSDAGNETVKPTVISVTTVMNCWVYSNSKEAPERVERLFQFLKDQFQMTGDKAMQPSQYTYNALIGAYARNSKRADAVEKAMGHFNHMMEEYNNSHENDIKPGPMHFSVVLSALAKRGLAEEAEHFLERVLTICREYHDAGAEKLEITSSFNNVISAHARSNLAGSALKAEKTLRRMQELDPDDSFIEASPTVVSYTSVMMAWSHAFGPEDKRMAVTKCEQLLQEMLEQAKAGDPSIMPNCFTFGTYLQVLSRSSVTDKKERAEQVLQFMEHSGIRPDHFVLSAAKDCSSSRTEAAIDIIKHYKHSK